MTERQAAPSRNRSHRGLRVSDPLSFVSRWLGCVLLVSLATACSSPFLVTSGGALRDPVVSEPVEDWSVTNSVDTFLLETRPDDPYSVIVNGVGAGDDFYIASQGWRRVMGGSDKARWLAYIEADPRVRLGVEGRVYELRAVRIQDEDELARVQQLFRAKYGEEAESWGFWLSEEPPWVYRLEPRSAQRGKAPSPVRPWSA